MQTGASIGMQTMDKALADLVRSGRIWREDAEERAQDKANLKGLLRSGR
jgi:Tfp pilus assembly pilus retraction ATPase PilT